MNEYGSNNPYNAFCGALVNTGGQVSNHLSLLGKFQLNLSWNRLEWRVLEPDKNRQLHYQGTAQYTY